MCIYIYIHIYTHMYMYAYIYIYIHIINNINKSVLRSPQEVAFAKEIDGFYCLGGPISKPCTRLRTPYGLL